MEKQLANVHSIESLATLDGEGIRYMVFFMNCPLRCVYCHNPDTWVGQGTLYGAEELANKIKRYKPYFNSNGGVTFSGGEPLLHSEFINEIAPMLLSQNINYALDTSGNICLSDSVKLAINQCDMVILDLKFWDKTSYAKYCKGDFEKVFEFGEFLHSINKKTWIRTVIVPGINDNTDILDKYLSIIRPWKNIQKYELLGFHTLGFSKYNALGIQNPLKDIKALDKSTLYKLQNYVDSFLNLRNNS